jgi:hypothetical protein
LRDLHLRRVFALFAALGGSSLTVPAYQKLEVGTYLEYGVYDWLTVVAAPAYDRVRTPPSGAILHWIGRERVRGKGRALPHGYGCFFGSSGLAFARRVV